MAAKRRNVLRPVDGALVAGIALVSAVAAAFSGAEPAGDAIADAVLAGGFAAAVTWAAASAPWWVLAVTGGAATAAALDESWLAAMAGTATCVALGIGATRANLPWLRAGIAGVIVQVALRFEVGGFFGSSALIAGAIGALLFVSGVVRRPRRVRRRAAIGGAIVAGLGFVALAGTGASVATARGDLQSGTRDVRRGLAAMRSGDTEAAASAFSRAADRLERGVDELEQPWSQLARFLPVASQHRAVAVSVGDAAAQVARQAAVAAADIDLDRLRLVNGGVDLDALAQMEAPLATLHEQVAELEQRVAEAPSAWLVPPIRDRLDSVAVEAADAEEDAAVAADAVRLAPRLLGADGPRHYFVAFMTPAEARGIGGFMGNYAVLTIDAGRLQMTAFGRAQDLVRANVDGGSAALSGPPDFLARYGVFGAGNAATPVSPEFWLNLTMSPDWPSVAAVMAELYPQFGGQHVDGVLGLDVFALAALLELSGPITLENPAVTLDADNAAEFLLRDQYYVSDTDERVEVLDLVAHEVTERLLTASLPEPSQLADLFAPLAAQGRLLVWSSDAQEQALFERLGAGGRFPTVDGADGLAVVSTNAGANKLDSFLRRTVHYEAQVDAAGGVVGETEITLRNDAPATGLPDYIVGNIPGRPPGTNHMYLSIYSPLVMERAELDGEPLPMQWEQELGWNVYSAYVTIPPEDEMTLRLELSGQVDAGRYRFVSRAQPLAVPDQLTARVTGPDGQVLVDLEGPHRGTVTIESRYD